MNSRLLQIEFRKSLKFRTFWILTGLFGVFLLLAVMAFQSIKPTEINGQSTEEIEFGFYSFPMVWHTVGYLAGYMGLFLAILVIINITNEYNFRTLRQHIIDGLGRGEFLFSKFSLVFILTAAATLWVFATSLLFGYLNTETPGEFSVFKSVGWIGIVGVQILGYLSLAGLVALFFRNAGLSIVMFIAYTLMIERIVWAISPDMIDRFFPAKSLSNLIPFPVPEQMIPPTEATGGQPLPFIPDQSMPGWEIGVAIVWIGVFWGVGYLLLKKRDL
ncbi:MAG: ABC transporter permease subunit [Bacteroidia bacterium]|nr:ABC transporter permease subunit [Bacteroidia bacterium]